MPVAILTAQGVEKSFGTRRVLGGVSFAVHEEDRVALVGLNGSGKSTLLRLLVGAVAPPLGETSSYSEAELHDAQPDAGVITRKRGLRVAFVPQEPRLATAPTVRDTLKAGLRVSIAAHARHESDELEDLEHEIRGLAAAFDLPEPGKTVGTLSLGERRRVAIAQALLQDPELLALDEPTNHLDASSIVWLEERLRTRAGALLLVTHDRYFLDRVATRILELDRGGIYAYEGGYSRFLELQAARLDNETARERQRASFVRRELDWIRRGPSARGTKQQARIDRFDAAVAARPTDRPQAPMSLRLPSGGRLGKTILELRHLSINWPGLRPVPPTGEAGSGPPAPTPSAIAGLRLVDDLTLVMKPGDRIGIVGPNGAGKTTLLHTILGLLPPSAGEVVVGQNTRFAFLDQGRANLRDDQTVLAEVAGDNEHVFLEDGPVHVRTFLRMMLFEDGFADTPVGALSGGERNRVQLAKLLRMGGNLLVLDEPTNDLDLATLDVLEEALVEFPGCALIVSHDRWFLDRVATAILAFEGDGHVELFEGNHASYLARRRPRRTAADTSAETPAPSAPPRRREPAPRKQTFKERQELAGMEAAITAAEAKVAGLEKILNDPAVYKDRPTDVPALIADLDAARHEVTRLYERWSELEQIPV